MFRKFGTLWFRRLNAMLSILNDGYTQKWSSPLSQVRQLRSDNCNGQVRHDFLKGWAICTNVGVHDHVRNCAAVRVNASSASSFQVNLAVAKIYLRKKSLCIMFEIKTETQRALTTPNLYAQLEKLVELRAFQRRRRIAD